MEKSRFDEIAEAILNQDKHPSSNTSEAQELCKTLENSKKMNENFDVGWQKTFDASIDIFAIISKDFDIVKINKTGYESIGKKPEELIGKKCYEVIHGLNSPIEGCPCQKALKTKTSGTGEISDHGRQYLTTASPILDKNDGMVAFAHTVKDISSLMNAQKELKRSNEILEDKVKKRTKKLENANSHLIRLIKEHIEIERELKKSKMKLQEQSETLAQKNAALTEVIDQIETTKIEMKKEIQANIDKIVLPILDKLKLENPSSPYVEMLRYYFENLSSSYGCEISSKTFKLSTRELELCNMIKAGLTSKEIANLLNISLKTVNKHRRNIRIKLEITNTEFNLSSFLRAL